MDFKYTQLASLLKKDEYLLRDLNVSFESGFKDHIDCVLVTHKGVIVIKFFSNVSDRIKGNDDDALWLTSSKDVNQMSKTVPNPVLQNKLHAEIIEQALKYKFKAQNIVILQDAWNIEDIHSSHAYTFLDFASIYEELPEKLDSSDVESIFKILKNFVH